MDAGGTSPDESALETVVDVVMGGLRTVATFLLGLAILVGGVALLDTALLVDVAPWWIALAFAVAYALLVAGLLRYRAQLRAVVARQDRLVDLLGSVGETATEVGAVLQRAEPALDGAGPVARLRVARRTWRDLTTIPGVDTALDTHDDITDPTLHLVWWSLPALAFALLALPVLGIVAIFR